MLTVKQVFEFARDGLLREQNLCIKCGDLSGVKKAIQTTAEIQSVLENLDKKENYIASSNPGTETAVLFALNLKDGEVQELRATQQQTKELYQVRIIHLNNDEQVLRFPILAAAQATFELLKYELKVGRIRWASIVKVIPSVGYKKELCHIGESKWEFLDASFFKEWLK